MDTTTDRPRYREVHHDPTGATDKRGRPVQCQGCIRKGREGAEIAQATWTGMRRPADRIMTYPFAMCDLCWGEERLR